jgi:hypothetical protein
MLLHTAATGPKRDTVTNNTQTRLRIFAFYEDDDHNLKIRSVRLHQIDPINEVYAGLMLLIFLQTLLRVQ